MKVIVGLGNPGSRYDGTRHNAGFAVIDELARRHAVGMNVEKFHAWFGDGTVAGEKVALLKPTTFMNRSGQAALAAGRFYKLDIEDLLVITDDLALPTGRLRMRAPGSAGSHNGLQDIISRLGTDEWARLRVGIGERTGSGSGYVLGRFSPEEEEIMEPAIRRAADAVECWIESGVEAAMNRFNGD